MPDQLDAAYLSFVRNSDTSCFEPTAVADFEKYRAALLRLCEEGMSPYEILKRTRHVTWGDTWLREVARFYRRSARWKTFLQALERVLEDYVGRGYYHRDKVLEILLEGLSKLSCWSNQTKRLELSSPFA